MTKQPLCDSCRHLDTAVEVRQGRVSEYKTCEYWHHWVNRVTKPEQCRDYKYVGDDPEC